MKKMLLTGLLGLSLVACSSDKSQLKAAINTDLNAHPVCVDFGKKTLPGQFAGDITHNTTLKVLAGAGLIQMTVKSQNMSDVPNGGTYYGTVTVLDLTPKGREKNIVDPKQGLCIGEREVVDVQTWTEPAASEGLQVTEANYTWQVGDLLFGINRQDFPDLPGMGKPIEAKATLKKMNDGWSVVDNNAY